MWVWLVLDDKDDVGGDGAGRFVALPWEGDLGSFLPAAFDLDGQDLVLVARGPSVGVQAPPRDLHALGAAMKDFLQRDTQLVMDRRILLPPRRTLARKSVQIKTREGTEGVAGVHLHVLVIPAVHLNRCSTAVTDLQTVDTQL